MTTEVDFWLPLPVMAQFPFGGITMTSMVTQILMPNPPDITKKVALAMLK
jgi:hypothetical protein